MVHRGWRYIQGGRRDGEPVSGMDGLMCGYEVMDWAGILRGKCRLLVLLR